MPLKELHCALASWFADTARDLPWRAADCSAWGVLVSEIMLQQTPVVRGLPGWEEWLLRWPAPALAPTPPPLAPTQPPLGGEPKGARA